MKFIKIIFINILLLTLLSSSGIGQDMTQIMFLNELDGQSAATYADALRMFRFHLQIRPEGSPTYLLKDYFDEVPLTKGMASLMMCRYIKLKKSLMYNIFDTERYAYRACLAEKFFSEYGSENDIMSGSELIEFFAKVGEFKSGR
jgi:formylmethanofuran dehydrogenase subunit E-like metal-binding protein